MAQWSCITASCRAMPDGSVNRTPTQAMPSAFSWPLLVPSALAGSGAGYLGS